MIYRQLLALPIPLSWTATESIETTGSGTTVQAVRRPHLTRSLFARDGQATVSDARSNACCRDPDTSWLMPAGMADMNPTSDVERSCV